MQVRSVVTAAALIVGLAAFAAPLTPPVTQRYKITETNHQVVDLSAFGQPEQTTHIVTSSFVTLVSTDSAAGRALKLTIDSIHIDSVESAQPIPREMFDSVRGVVATGFLPADGKVTGLAGQGDRGAMAVNLLRSLFPRMAPRAKVGDHWTDTTETTGMGSGILSAASIRRVTNWAVSGEETVNGAKARKVDGAFSQSVSGENESGQGTMSIDGTGTGTVSYGVAADGRILRVNSTMDLHLSISIPQAPEPIPVNGTVSSAITQIR